MDVVEPTTAAEAARYVGQPIAKWFMLPHLETGEPQNVRFEGYVAALDTELVTDAGTETGLFFAIHYPQDDDYEHVLWPELKRMLAQARQVKVEGAGPSRGRARACAAGGAGAGEGSSDENQRPEVDGELEVGGAGTGGRKRRGRGDGGGDGDGSDRDAGGGRACHRRRRQRQAPGGGDAGGHSSVLAAVGGGESAAAAAAADEGMVLDDEDAEAGTQQELRQRGNPGHLLRIKLENFMCHENFEMEFGPHVNVVAGTNGSGKSAVLQGLQCCLGASARGTGRAPRMGDFIRTGAHEARVKVTLWNSGADAFDAGRLGRMVTVERRILPTTTSFHVFDERGSKVKEASSKAYIDRMLDHFSVNACNALAVMTQDTARSFLSGAVADRRKYELFMEGTMLADWQARLRDAEARITQMTQGMASMKEDFQRLRAELKEAEGKLKKLEEADGLVEAHSKLETAVFWAALEERTQAVTNLDHAIDEVAPRDIAHIHKLRAPLQGRLEALRHEEQQQVARQAEIQASSSSFNAVLQDAQKLVQEARRARGTANRRREAAAQRHAAVRGQLDALLQSQRDSGNAAAREAAARLEEHRARLGVAEAARSAAAVAAERAKAEWGAAQQREKELEAAAAPLEADLQRCNAVVSNYMESKRQLLEAQRDSRARFGGQSAVLLHQRVTENRHAFERVPIGPIGAHLTLADAKWAVAAEVALGFELNKWVVHSFRDQKVLRDLAAQINPHFGRSLTIMRTSFDQPPHRVPPHVRPVVGQSQVVLKDLVQVDHPQYGHIIDNKLMDMTKYEQVVLTERPEHARHLVTRGTAGAHVRRAIALNGDQYMMHGGGTVQGVPYHRAGGRGPRLGCAPDEQLHEVEALLQQELINRQRLADQLRNLSMQRREAALAAGAAFEEYRRCQMGAGRASRCVAELQSTAPDALEMAGCDGSGGDDGGGGVLAELNASVMQSQAELRDGEEELAEATQREDNARQLLEEHRSELMGLQGELQQLLDALTRIGEEKGRAEQELARADALLAQTEGRLEQHRAAREGAQLLLEEARSAAHSLCNEVEGVECLEYARALIRQRYADAIAKQAERQKQQLTEEEVAELLEQNSRDKLGSAGIEEEAGRLEKRIKAAEGEAGGSKIDLQRQVVALGADVALRRPRYDLVCGLIGKFRAMLDTRQKSYTSVRSYLESEVSHRFNKYMNLRGHRGNIAINEDAGELRTMVRIHAAANQGQNNKAATVKDLKQLSGGERSFTTVAFILALGHHTESPFRALDEFDVFMDAINRRIATETLLQFALDQPHLQFVLLTPQDLQAVEDAKQHLVKKQQEKKNPNFVLPDSFVRVVQMRPARSNATRAI